MIAVLAVLLQASAPAPAAAEIRPATSRTLSGRFACDAAVYEVQVTSAPGAGMGVTLDRLTIAGKPVDTGSLAEARRMLGRLSDVQSLDVRCRDDGAGELSMYGVHVAAGAAPRRARLRGVLHDGGVSNLAVGVEQR